MLGVRWSLRDSLSERDLEDLLLERGLQVEHTTRYALVQRYAPELDKRSGPHRAACIDSGRVEETSIKVKKVWMYLYRAVVEEGNTGELLLSPTREAAKGFFKKALQATAGSASRARPTDEKEAEAAPATECAAGPAASAGITATPLPLKAAPRWVPRLMKVEKNAASPKAEASLKASGPLREAVEGETWSTT